MLLGGCRIDKPEGRASHDSTVQLCRTCKLRWLGGLNDQLHGRQRLRRRQLQEQPAVHVLAGRNRGSGANSCWEYSLLGVVQPLRDSRRWLACWQAERFPANAKQCAQCGMPNSKRATVRPARAPWASMQLLQPVQASGGMSLCSGRPHLGLAHLGWPVCAGGAASKQWQRSCVACLLDC